MPKSIEEIKQKLVAANKAYRLGLQDDKNSLTDAEYDLLKEELSLLSPNDPLLDEIGIVIPDSDVRKQKLPITMASMNKIRTKEEILAWAKKHNISPDTLMIQTPKLDGMSLVVDETKHHTFTRGDGVYGQRSDEHYKLLGNQLSSPMPAEGQVYTFGEAIMSRENFKKYSEKYVNPRNYIAGLINTPEATEPLADAHYLRYGLVADAMSFTTRAEQMQYLNLLQHTENAPQVPYDVKKLSEVTEEYLKELFLSWNKDFEIDGIIVEVNDLKLQKELGREHNNNPAYARAFKGDFEEVKEADFLGVTYNTSKQGYAKPIIHITPVVLDGATVSNVTGNNARYMLDMGIGSGSKFQVKRSGMVIPKIIKVLTTGNVELPTHCTCGGDFEWNENKVELVCTNVECAETQLQRTISFFQTLEVDNVSDGNVQQLFDAGYNTIQKILNVEKADMEKLDRFGKRKAEILYDSIRKKLASVSLSKLQHASGLFKNLGSKKLLLLEHFEQLPTIEEITAIEGFSEKSAKAYLSAMPLYLEFQASLPDYITVNKTEKKEATSAELAGSSFVFTGVRRKDLEEIILQKGGTIAGSVSKTTTYLIMKEKGSGSSKEVKAEKLGVKILDVQELEKLLS